jgi:hypothetical protein
MDGSTAVTEPDDVLDLDALDDDVQHWVDLMPEHFETKNAFENDDPFTAYSWPSYCSCNNNTGPYAGC